MFCEDTELMTAFWSFKIRSVDYVKYEFKTTSEKSKQMSKVRSANGKDEVILRKLLWHMGLRYRVNVKNLPGKPDIVLSKYKIAIFIDGEFWHGYEWKKRKSRIKNNREYWIWKIQYNINHDSIVNQALHDQGWTILRFWSKKVLKNPDYYANLVLYYVNAVITDSDARGSFFQG